LLVKGDTGDSHRGGAEALHDDFLALKGKGTMILRNFGNHFYRQGGIPDDLNLTLSSTVFKFKHCTGSIKMKTKASQTILF